MVRIESRRSKTSLKDGEARTVVSLHHFLCLPYSMRAGISTTLLNQEERMKRIVSTLLSITFVLALGITVSAQQTPSVDRREHRQQRRINQGVRSGSLSGREAARMERQQARTRRLEAKAKADGKVTRRERARLQHRENRTSRRIYRQKHDRNRR